MSRILGAVGGRPLAMISNVVNEEGDGIGDHTRLLQYHLEAAGVGSDVLGRSGTTWLVRASADGEFTPGSAPDSRYGFVVVHYNPFMYGRWGVAGWLPALLWRLRMAHPRPRLVLVAHETYYRPVVNLRSALMSVWQRGQLRAAAAACDAAGASIEVWRDLLAGYVPRRPALHFPIPSNLPDMRAQRGRVRAALGVGDDEVVLTTLSIGHPSHHDDIATAAAAAVARDRGSAVLLRLGKGGRTDPQPPGVRVIATGRLSAVELASHLAASNLFLAPFVDGVSTRRTSVMAAMQHGLPIVGTDGSFTGRALRAAESGLTLVSASSSDAFVGAARCLARDPSRRAVAGKAAARFYATNFDWPVAVDRFGSLLAAADAAP